MVSQATAKITVSAVIVAANMAIQLAQYSINPLSPSSQVAVGQYIGKLQDAQKQLVYQHKLLSVPAGFTLQFDNYALRSPILSTPTNMLRFDESIPAPVTFSGTVSAIAATLATLSSLVQELNPPAQVNLAMPTQQFFVGPDHMSATQFYDTASDLAYVKATVAWAVHTFQQN